MYGRHQQRHHFPPTTSTAAEEGESSHCVCPLQRVRVREVEIPHQAQKAQHRLQRLLACGQHTVSLALAAARGVGHCVAATAPAAGGPVSVVEYSACM